jgi:hypothetical protein
LLTGLLLVSFTREFHGSLQTEISHFFAWLR